MKRLVILLSLSLPAFSAPILSCFNNSPTGGVGFSYENCVNRNFREIRYQLNLRLDTCTNWGTQVNPSYPYCIDRNFREIRREFPSYFMRSCTNYGPNLSWFFQNCVNDNFRTAERIIRELDLEP
ncbi:MAG: hypothetical protein CME69_11760 [Halobacteriovorax sp.]|nr:hypothetical protein [Halobacteriovorax sp.]|tara:strand:- start:847 stop:1221 length:375 start_codon:yes stop_codon:yes gene_type:complete